MVCLMLSEKNAAKARRELIEVGANQGRSGASAQVFIF